MAKAPLLPTDRRPDESDRHHRAFLLYAMQDPRSAPLLKVGGQRSFKQASRAVGCSASTIQEWGRRFDWLARTAADGIDAQAIRAYRELYYPKYRSRELAIVERFMSVSLLPDDPPPSERPSERDEASRQAEVIDAKSSGAADQRGVEKSSDRERKMLGGMVTMTDGLIMRGFRRLSDLDAEGKLTIGLKDLPNLIRMRSILTERIDATEQPTGGQIVQRPAESRRVRDARENGGDVLAAIAIDLDELRVVIDGIRAKREQEEADRAFLSGPTKLTAIPGGRE
jgi:hypothetical protein